MAKRFRIQFSSAAEDDLENIAFWIADQMSSFATALRYTKRVRDFTKSLRNFPDRGTRRDDVVPGLRINGFERRVAIAFQIAEDTVLIVRLFYGGRDLGALREDAAPIAEDESGDISET